MECGITDGVEPVGCGRGPSLPQRKNEGPGITLCLASDLYDLKRAGIGLRPGIRILRSRRDWIILCVDNQKDVMGLRIERNSACAINRLDIRDQTNLIG